MSLKFYLVLLYVVAVWCLSDVEINKMTEELDKGRLFYRDIYILIKMNPFTYIHKFYGTPMQVIFHRFICV